MNEDLKEALGATAECAAIDLEDGGSEAAGHIAHCAHCQTELALLREFQSGGVRPEEKEPVNYITARLARRAGEIVPVPQPWWKAIFTMPWSTQGALAMASVLVLVSAGLYLTRSGAPALRHDVAGDVMRSAQLSTVSPMGDLAAVPADLKWRAAAGAVKYRVRLMEVDHNELWKAETAETSVQIPASIKARIVPAKTILWDVTALDAGGANIAATGIQSFRVRPNGKL